MELVKPTGMGRRRAAASSEPRVAYQQRRKEIGEVAVRVFNQRGYKGASLSAVAAEMGVDRATLYYYVSSKEQLFDEITRSVLEANDQVARQIVNSPISPMRKMRELVTAMMRSYAENYPLLFIYIREDLAHVSDKRSEWSIEMRRLNRSIERSVIGIVEQGYADGSFRRMGSARTVAYGILGMLNWTHRWFRPEQSESPEEIGKVFAEMVLSGLESPYQAASISSLGASDGQA